MELSLFSGLETERLERHSRSPTSALRDRHAVDGAAQLRRYLLGRLRELRSEPRVGGDSVRFCTLFEAGWRSVSVVVSSVRILRRDIPPPEVLLGTRARVAEISPGARRPETADLVGHHIRRFGTVGLDENLNQQSMREMAV